MPNKNTTPDNSRDAKNPEFAAGKGAGVPFIAKIDAGESSRVAVELLNSAEENRPDTDRDFDHSD